MRYLLIGGLLLLAPSARSACREVTSGLEDPFQFAQAFVESLSYAQLAFARADQSVTGPRSSDGFMYMTESLSILKLKASDFDHAAQAVCGYTKSKDKFISEAADTATFVFAILSLQEIEFADVERDMLDHPDQKLGRLADRISDAKVRMDEAWDLLFTGALPMTTWAITDIPKGADEKLSTLRLTTAQREMLIKKLEDAFGSDIKDHGKPGEFIAVATAAQLYKHLADKNWKSLPTR